MSLGDVFQACEKGAVFSASPAELREMLQALAHAGGQNPSFHSKVAQCGATIRHLLELKEARQSQGQTLRWARIAGVAAVLGVLLMLAQCAQSYFRFRAGHDAGASAVHLSSPTG